MSFSLLYITSTENFLPFLPLVIGCVYYVKIRRSFALAELLKVDEKQEICYLKYIDTGDEIKIVKEQIFCGLFIEDHYKWLLGGDKKRSLI